MRVRFSDSHLTLHVVSSLWKRLNSVWLMGNWLGFPLNQIQGWTTVRESYSRALEQGPLLSSFPLPGFSSQLLHEAVRGPRGAGPAGGHARPAVARVLHRDHPAGVAIGGYVESLLPHRPV